MQTMSGELRSEDKGFTLIEILAVLAIVSVMAGLLVMAAKGARKRADIDAAKAGVSFVAAKIDAYRNKRGDLPPDLGGPAVPAVTTEFEIYKTLDKWGFAVPPDKQVDPWGNPYIIVLDRDYGAPFNMNAPPDYTTPPFNKMAGMYSTAVPQPKEIQDAATNPYNNENGGFQVISAGLDGLVSQTGSDDVNADNFVNW